MFNRRILIVDSNSETTLAMKFIIESYGNAFCDIVTDALEALYALKNYDYQMVLLDKAIPGLDGNRVLEQMDLMVDYEPQDFGDESKAVPVVLMSTEEPRDTVVTPLKHFELISYLRKQDLSHFLSNNFAN